MGNYSCTNPPIIQRLANLDHQLIQEEFMPFHGHRMEVNYSVVPVTNQARFGMFPLSTLLGDCQFTD